MRLNTKWDYYTVKKLYPVTTWYKYWARLNEDREMWYDRGLVDKDKLVEDATHKWKQETQVDPETKEESTVYRQYELAMNPLHPFYRLHFRQEEVDAALAEAKEALS